MIAVVAIVVGALILTAGIAMAFVRTQILSDTHLRDRSLAALDEPAVRGGLTTVVTDLLATRVPEAESAVISEEDVASAVDTAVAQPAFRVAFGATVQQTRDRLVDGDISEIALPLDEMAGAITPGLAQVSPALAQEADAFLREESIPVTTDGDVATVSRIMRTANVLGAVLPIVAILCFALGLLVARRRSGALIGVGVAVAASGAAVILLAVIGRTTTESLTDPEHTDVATAVWNAFAGDIHTWGVLTAIIGGAVVLAGLVLTLVRERNRHLSAPA